MTNKAQTMEFVGQYLDYFNEFIMDFDPVTEDGKLAQEAMMDAIDLDILLKAVEHVVDTLIEEKSEDE